MEPIRIRRSTLPVTRGFTLVELMVVVAIMIVVMGVVFANQSSFNRSLILANTAYDIALTIRSAETFGLSSRASSVSANAPYGVRFTGGGGTSFTFFADTSPAASCSLPNCRPGDYVYTAQDSLVQTYTLGNGMRIQDFCAQTSGVYACASSGALTTLDIVFARPNPDPFMSANGVYSAAFPVTRSCLTITSPQGGAKYISISASGAITPNVTSCP